MHQGDSRQNVGLAVGGGVPGELNLEPYLETKDSQNGFRKNNFFKKNLLSRKQDWNVCLSLGKAD